MMGIIEFVFTAVYFFEQCKQAKALIISEGSCLRKPFCLVFFTSSQGMTRCLTDLFLPYALHIEES